MQKNPSKIIVADEFSLDNYIFPLIKGDRIFFYGDLGAGKSTFIRHLLRAHFHDPNLIVRSPTYTYYQKYKKEVPHPLTPSPSEKGNQNQAPSPLGDKGRKECLHDYSEVGVKQGWGEVIYHFDLYRIEDLDTFHSIGGMEILENPETIALIEWPEVLEPIFRPTKKIFIKTLEDGRRKITIERLY